MKYYVGNCVNSFDNNSNCIVSDLPYRDVTDFAQGEEEAEEISLEQFSAAVGPHEIKVKKPIFFHDADNDVYMLYDAKKDIHYFFVG
jgi:hypothetical protein